MMLDLFLVFLSLTIKVICGLKQFCMTTTFLDNSLSDKAEFSSCLLAPRALSCGSTMLTPLPSEYIGFLRV